jgi:hypothetical protein
MPVVRHNWAIKVQTGNATYQALARNHGRFEWHAQVRGQTIERRFKVTESNERDSFSSGSWCAMTLLFTDDSYFPIKTKAGEEGVTAFEAQWYGKSLERMKEPRLPDFAKDDNVDLYRIMILPTWGNPIAVRVQRHGELYSLSARRLDGQGGYDPGKLVEAKDIELGADDSRSLGVVIQNLDFFQMPTDDDVRGLDGDEWIIEGVSQGKYHVGVRWCADSYDPKKRKLTTFLALCRFLLDKSALSERPKNKGHRLI